ncbi:MAG TPA: hypothetical protein VG346_06440 [Acidimicrobiales bacterium]|jgi:Zn finger protein HypA/HybF involved in hydrogenase expression|nr:hypothetical protein [Acidimicrobiales bacterium]
MHELPICSAIANAAAKHAEGRSVSRVTEIGHARTTLDLSVLACGSCGCFEGRLVSGEELRVVSIDRVGA